MNNSFAYLKYACLSVIGILFFSTVALAHYPWISMDDYTPKTGSNLKMVIGWGHAYPSYSFLDKDSVKTLQMKSASGKAAGLGFISHNEIRSESAITTAGAYIVTGERKPGFYTKTTSGGKRSSKKGLSNVLSCSFSHMCMKAVVNVGDEKGRVDMVIGQPMEIIPLVNPSDLKSGDYLPVKVLFQGKPFSGYIYATYTGFSTETETFAYTMKTDKKGKGKIRILQPGVWMIKTAESLPYPDEEECDSQSYIATLTFEVK